MNTVDFAKILNMTGNASGLTRDVFHAELMKLAKASQRENETVEQAYRRTAIETPAGRELFKAIRLAPAPKAAQETPVTKSKPEPVGPASRQINDMARAKAAETGVSFEKAFTKVYTDPKNIELRARVRAEEFSAKQVA